MGVVKRAWIPLVITVVVVVVGGFVAYRLHGAFASHGVTTAGQVERVSSLNVKLMTYEVDGPPDTVGYIDYLDENAQPHSVQFASLPWSRTVHLAGGLRLWSSWTASTTPC